MSKRDRNTIFLGIGISIFSLCLLSTITPESNVSKIKSGKAELVCYIDNQYKVIDPKKVVDYIPEKDAYVFTNGYARNCEMNEINKTK